MRIPSDTRHIRRASYEIEKFLRSINTDDSLIFDIRLSVEEALKNAIIHGNKNDRKIPVFISYSMKGGKFRVEVEDQGSGFDPASVPDPTAEENLLKAAGRGVFLIGKLMDEVEYNDKGNKIFMLKLVPKNKGGHDAG